MLNTKTRLLTVKVKLRLTFFMLIEFIVYRKAQKQQMVQFSGVNAHKCH